MSDYEGLDKILDQIGHFGKHQLISFALLGVIAVFHGFEQLAYVFISMDSDYRCFIPTCDDSQSIYQSAWVHYSIPKDLSGAPRKCDMYEPLPINMSSHERNCSADMFNKERIVRCSSFIFKNNDSYVLKEYKLYCESQRWKLSLVGTVGILGVIFGLCVTGTMSDKYGRKFTILICMTSCGFIGIIKTFMPSYELFCLMEFLENACASGVFGGSFILVMELVVPKKRIWAGCFIFTFYTLGEMLLAIVAWYVEDWRKIMYLSCGPAVFCIFLYPFLPESIRWHLNRGETEKPIKLLNKYARANGKTISSSDLHQLERYSIIVEKSQNEGLRDMVKSWYLFSKLIICCYLSFTCTLVYFGVSLQSVNSTGNSYFNFFFISLMDIPAYVVNSAINDRIGRRLSLSLAYLISSVCFLSSIFLDNGNELLVLLAFCLGKFGTSISFQILFMMNAEIFPTTLRQSAMSVCGLIGKLGGVISAQIILLSLLWKPFPLLIFTLISLVAAILSLCLPETSIKKLPDTVKEASFHEDARGISGGPTDN